jgi:hypothetical protein
MDRIQDSHKGIRYVTSKRLAGLLEWSGMHGSNGLH